MVDIKVAPEEILYDKFAAKETDGPFVKDSVVINSELRSVYWLFRMVNDGYIKSLSPYLQRILLTKVWQADNFMKAKSYVRDMWIGLSPSTPFFLVPLDIVLNNIEESEQINSNNPDVLFQITEVKTKILEFKKDKVEFINLDGQTRSKESIVPYITSQFTLESTHSKPLLVKNSKGKYVNISKKLFSELDDVQRGYFFSINLLINTMEHGSLDSITGALISINSNEKWTKWQEIYNGTWISVYPKRIGEVYETDESGPIKDFFREKVKSSKKDYKPDVSGLEQWIAEHLYFLKNKQYPTMKQLKIAFTLNTSEVPTEINSKALREYLMEIRDNYTSNDRLMQQFVSDWCLFRDIISNYSLAKTDPYYSHFDVKKMTILSTGELLEWFMKTTERLNAEEYEVNGKLVANEESYIFDGKKWIPKDDSLPSHKKGGFKFKSIMGRMKIMINKLNEDFDELVKSQTISEATTMPSKAKVLAANDYRSNAGVPINPTKSSSDKYERGHVKSRKNGGEDVVTNLKPQVKDANRAYSGRNMTTTKKKGK